MPVIGLGQQFSAGVLNDDEGPDDRTSVSGRPTDALVSGIVYALVCNGDNLPVIWNQIAECAKTTSGIARHPGNASVGREFYVIVGGVDPDQLVAVGY